MTEEIKNTSLTAEEEPNPVSDEKITEAAEQEPQTDNSEPSRYEIDMTAAEESIPDYVKTREPVYDFELEGRKKRRRPRKRGIGCLGGAIYLLVVIALSIGLSVFALTVVNDVTGLDKKDIEIEVTIPQGATLSDIATILRENGLIENEIGLLAFAKLTKTGSNYQPGTFTLNPRMGYEEILKAISQQVIIRETVDVTIIEGKTIEEIAEKLDGAGVCKKDEFLSAIQETDFSEDYEFLSSLTDTEDRIYKLEGYIFPNTYNFYKASSPEEVITKFLDEFDTKFSKELRDEAEKQGMTIDEVINLASIVQKEGITKKSMEMVAGVFINRLDNPTKYPYLQSNATLSYALGTPLLWMTEEQMKDDNIYNTYVHEGLPPSPICNPGEQAIKAVLYPEDSDYYYFVTDSNNKFYFSKTLSQHEKQVSAIQKNGVGIGEGIS